jgi:hypothetical protein
VRKTARRQPRSKSMRPSRSLADWIEPASVSTKPRFSCPKLEVRLERRGNVFMISPKELAAARSGCNRVPDFPFKMR